MSATHPTANEAEAAAAAVEPKGKHTIYCILCPTVRETNGYNPREKEKRRTYKRFNQSQFGS